MQYSLRHLMIAASIVAVVAYSMALGITRARHNMEANQSTYAARLVAKMCVEHMKTNGLAWPRDWDELQDEFAPCLARSGQTWTFAELKKRVAVDWKADPNGKSLSRDSNPVVWVASDPSKRFYGIHPNEIVSEYLATASKPGS